MGNKTKTQMRADLATDLKITIDTEITAAELNRSIERAYSDMSRFLPDEKIYEDSHQFAVTSEVVTFPKDAGIDVDEIVDAMDISAVVAGDYVSTYGVPIIQPDVPRPLVITLTDASNSIATMTIIIEGLDKDDQGVQETFFYSLGDSKTIVGKKYFKSIYTIEFDQIAGNGAGDILDIGYSAYTDVWVYLANSPIKWQSESGTDAASNTIVRNTDFYIDYANGRVKAIASANIAAEEVCTFAYKKSQIGIDISDLPDLIRVQRVEYPVGQVPQTFVTFDVFGKYIVVTGTGESGEQQQMAEDQQYRIYYDTCQQMPGENTPGTEPKFLTNTILMAAAAYALYILALKQEHQVATDIASARSALGNATGTHSNLALALTDVEKYLDNNSDADAAGRLAQITTDITDLENAIITAAEAMNAYLDKVGVDTTGDIAKADGVRTSYMTTTNYVSGGSEPDILAYLTAGDALLNEVAKGGEGQDVPRAYAEFAMAVKNSLVGAFENDRAMYLQDATARTNAAMVYAQEAAQRLSLMRVHMDRASGYVAIANTFSAKAGHYLSQVVSYLRQASQYVEAAAADTALADRFKAEADERRNEVYGIWRDRKQYIGDFTAGSMRQMPDYK